MMLFMKGGILEKQRKLLGETSSLSIYRRFSEEHPHINTLLIIYFLDMWKCIKMR